jgi:hypothetical protein
MFYEKQNRILNELRLFVPFRYPKLGHGVFVLTSTLFGGVCVRVCVCVCVCVCA